MRRTTVDPFDGSFSWFDTTIIHFTCGEEGAISEEYDAIDWIYDHMEESH
jgi:hypothetical protein